MAFMRRGVVSTLNAFGKAADYERIIKMTGQATTPFYSSIPSVAQANRDANIASGHRWAYDIVGDGDKNNRFAEGSEAAEAKRSNGAELVNHYHIVKETFGVTGSEAVAKRVDGQTALAAERKDANNRIRKSIEMILLSEDDAVQRTDSVAGRCGGLKSFATVDNTIDAANAELNMQTLRDILKIGWKSGQDYKILMMSDHQKDKIDNILFEKGMNTNLSGSVLDNKVTKIGQTSYGSDIKIILSPFLENNEIIAYNPNDILVVIWRTLSERKLPSSVDAEMYELVMEFTLRVCTPYSFTWVKNLKV